MLILSTIALTLVLLSPFAQSQNDVLTQHNDVGRTGQNLNEPWLKPANVNINQFGKLFSQSVDGVIVGQPLYASGVLMNDGVVHNVVYVATQHNTVYAFDADSNQGSSASPLWAVSLNGAGTPDPISDFGCTGTHFTEIGVTSTPVIDAAKTTLYVVAKTVNGADREFNLHALDLRTGSEGLGGPTQISGTYGPTQTFNVLYQLQRPALLLENGTIYIGFGGNGCDIYTYNGWLFAYDAQTLQQKGVFEVAPNGKKSSIWQGGAGPSADASGNIYVVTANGTYDGPDEDDDFGDSVLKLGWDGAAFGLLDFFTPFNQFELQDDDLDLGSAGALILPDQPGLYPHELIAGGKEGTLYLINRDELGGYNPDDDNVIQSFPGFPFELTGVQSYWNGSVYVAGDHDYIKQYSLVNGMMTPQPVSQSTVIFGGAGAASTSITSNGNQNGIVWALGHSNHILYAFDAADLSKQLYNSSQALHARDKLGLVTRFVTPTVSDGRVYVGEKTALTVYGLLSTLSSLSGNNQSGTRGQTLAAPLVVLASDGYSHAPAAGVSVTCEDGKAGGQFLNGETQTTDATGSASFTYQLPRSLKVITIKCTNPRTSSTTFTETSASGVPTTLSIVSGNKQTAPPNTLLSKPLVVKVVDASGLNVPGITVFFTDNGAGGTFSLSSVVTNSQGRASTQYTTGPKTGSVAVTASVTGLNPVNFTLTVQ